MAMSTSLQRFFERHGVQAVVHDHAPGMQWDEILKHLGLSAEQVLIPVILQSEKKAMLMAVVPLSRLFDVERLNALLRRQFQRVDAKTVSSIFYDAEPGAEPPFGDAYRIPSLIDRCLLSQDRVYFRGGCRQSLVSVSGDDFRFLVTSAPKAIISNERVSAQPVATSDRNEAGPLSADAIRSSLEKIHRLPPMPPMAAKIIQTVNDPNASAEELAEWVELDPSVSAQIIRYASSPYYGYRGKVTSVREAITRVLGFELVGHIALGIASSRAFKVERDGPLGLKAFWQHALSCAVLSQALARKVNNPILVNPSTAYLAGLLHNLGVLLVGHLFQPEFSMLNKLVRNQPAEPLHKIEKRIIGLGQAQQVIALGHGEIGAVLLSNWNLPEAVVNTCRHHHDDKYQGDDAPYVQLIQIANVLLSHQGIGDLGNGAEPLPLPEHTLPLSDANIAEVSARIIDMYAEISELADRIAA